MCKKTNYEDSRYEDCVKEAIDMKVFINNIRRGKNNAKQVKGKEIELC